MLLHAFPCRPKVTVGCIFLHKGVMCKGALDGSGRCGPRPTGLRSPRQLPRPPPSLPSEAKLFPWIPGSSACARLQIPFETTGARLISPRPRRIPSHPLCLLAGAEAKPAAFEVQRISISVELAASEPIAPAGEGPQVGRVAGERDAPGPDSTRAAVTPSSFSKGYLASRAIRIFFLSSAAQ